MTYELKSILYCTDLGSQGPKVIKHAFGIARAFGAKIHILHVLEPIGEFAHALIDTYVPVETRERLRREGFEDVRREVEQRLSKHYSPADYSDADGNSLISGIRSMQGIPFEVILEEADRIKADLIVMGSHGHTAFGEMLLGSVAHKVTLRAKAPVLMVPIKAD